MDISPDAIFGAVVTIGLAALLGFWKLATMLTEVRGQVRPNGGSTIRDNAEIAATEARKAREAAETAKALAERVAEELVTERRHAAQDMAEQTAATSKLQHDVTTVKAGQVLQLAETAALAERVEQVREEGRKGRESLGERMTGMRDEIGDELDQRRADAYELLAEHGGPDLRPHLPGGNVAAHTHELPTVEQPSMTGGPIEPEE